MRKLGIFYFILSQFLFGIDAIAGGNKEYLAMQTQIAQADTPKKAETIVFGSSKIGLKIQNQRGNDATFNLTFDKTATPSDVDLNLHFYESSQAMIDAFHRGEINALIASPLELMELDGKTSETFIAINDQNVSAKQSFVLLVRKSDAISDIKQLSQKRLSMPPLQDLATLYLNTQLLDRNAPKISQFFSEVFESKNANIAVMDVFFGKSDVTIVREDEFKHAVSLNSQVAEQLMVLEKSPTFLGLVSASKKSVDEKKFKQTLFSITGVTKTVDGKKQFKVINADALQVVSRTDLLEVEELLARYKSLSKNKEKNDVE
jgi:hypothetical protein